MRQLSTADRQEIVAVVYNIIENRYEEVSTEQRLTLGNLFAQIIEINLDHWSDELKLDAFSTLSQLTFNKTLSIESKDFKKAENIGRVLFATSLSISSKEINDIDIETQICNKGFIIYLNILNAIGDSHFSNGKFDQALESYGHALVLMPNNVEIKRKFRRAQILLTSSTQI